MGALPRVRILGFVSLTSLSLHISVHGAWSCRWACGSQCSVGTLPISLLSPPNTYPALGTSVAPIKARQAVLGARQHCPSQQNAAVGSWCPTESASITGLWDVVALWHR